LDPDLEALDASIEVTHRPGPKVSIDPVIRTRLLDAITTERQVVFQYTNVRGTKTATEQVSPVALIMGPRAYLIGWDEAVDAIRNYALTGIQDIVVSQDAARRDPFDARTYVAQSFGAFHDGQFQNWVFRFCPETAYELTHYQFHPSQTISRLPSGEVEISFYCESIREVAYECFRWSEHLTWIGPQALRNIVREISDAMQAACGG
jgi:predicted DNA-binding transcriptional regulator YafY